MFEFHTVGGTLNVWKPTLMSNFLLSLSSKNVYVPES